MVAATSWTLPDGRAVWAAVVWTRPGGGLARPESRVFLFAPETGDILDGAP